MADRVDALVQATQAPAPHAAGDRRVGEPELEQLRTSDHSVLAPRERSQHRIRPNWAGFLPHLTNYPARRVHAGTMARNV
jgi:hypothetical protein